VTFTWFINKILILTQVF